MRSSIDDLTYYYRLPEPERPEGRMFREALADWVAENKRPRRRWPVRNREPRTPIPSLKRALIHARDGQWCLLCGNRVRFAVDHIIPRSAFRKEDLVAADRSDNLRSVCFDCNQKRSNYETVGSKRLGVAVACWYCQNPHPDETDSDVYAEYCEAVPEDVLPVFCGRCGVSWVPSVTWVL
ncbi:HNH endonuclease signature motif containing protein [Saxibacter everestensis]|uniref:HNH endonuclease signature motif containing protein n=1 Tax=Saxibacter everestensis TaxID=2909229 RepID=A0ABY8QUP3_9MICO|nr:HNH endonuclease signature motif containing protein [Brevibacteriaceae bacterium ZFBP1038]